MAEVNNAMVNGRKTKRTTQNGKRKWKGLWIKI